MEQKRRTFAQMRHSHLSRVWQILVIAGPYSLALLVVAILELLNAYYAGQLGTLELQGVGLGMIVLMLFGFALIVGFIYGYEVLGPQAYGAENYSRMGHYFNRARILLFILNVVTFPIFYFAGNVLYSVGINKAISDFAGNFLRLTYPGFLFKSQAILARVHMKAQRIMWPALIIQLCLLVIHISGLQIFVFQLGLGYSGIGLAFSVSFTSEFFITYCFLLNLKEVDKRTLVSFSRQDLRGWCEYLRVAFSGVALVAIEWWAVQIVSLFITYIGQNEFAAQTIFTNLFNSLVIVAYGFGTSLNSIIGNAMGMNDSRLAILFYRDALALAFILIVLLLTLLNLFGTQIISSFTSNVQVIELADSCLLFLSIELFFDMLQNVLSGVMRGLSLFNLAIWIMIMWLWGVYEPLALGLGIYLFQSLKTIYTIQACAMAGLALCYYVILQRRDWKGIADSIHHKMKYSQLEEPLLDDILLDKQDLLDSE